MEQATNLNLVLDFNHQHTIFRHQIHVPFKAQATSHFDLTGFGQKDGPRILAAAKWRSPFQWKRVKLMTDLLP